MKLIEGVLCNYLRAFPQDMERMYEAIEHILGQGIGGDLLVPLARRSFRDTDKEYMNKIKKEAKNRDDGLLILCSTIVKWYLSWKESFANFSDKNADTKYRNEPLQTWLHCLLTGQMDIFQNLEGQELVVVEKATWNTALKESERFKENIIFSEKKEELPQPNNIAARLLQLYELDLDLQIKEKLFRKKVAFFLEKEWHSEQIEELKVKYHFSQIRQFSSITSIGEIGFFDYYVFLTSRASHSVTKELESKVAKDKIFLIDSTNKERVMEELITQLKGK